jgi:hypothetical protein
MKRLIIALLLLNLTPSLAASCKRNSTGKRRPIPAAPKIKRDSRLKNAVQNALFNAGLRIGLI